MEPIWVAVIAGAFGLLAAMLALIGSIYGSRYGAKQSRQAAETSELVQESLVLYRLAQLEKTMERNNGVLEGKMDKNNHLIVRMQSAENDIGDLGKKEANTAQRVKELEKQ